MPVEAPRQRELIGEIVAEERWVLDTAYGAHLDLVLPRAELVVGLDYPRRLSLARLVRRTVSRVVTQEPMCNGDVETCSTTTRSSASTGRGWPGPRRTPST